MLYANDEIRQQLARDRRDALARDMRLARRTRPEAAPSTARRYPLGRLLDAVQGVTRSRPAHGRLSQGV